MNSLIEPGKPYETSRLSSITKDFYRDGFVYIPGVLNAAEVATLKSAVDRFFADPSNNASDNLYGDFIGVRLFERDRVFEDMLTKEPIIGMMEHILGADCHLVAQNVVRNKPGTAIDNFHVDDHVEFPLPDDMPRHDARLTLPVMMLTVQILLTDVPSVEYGPSEYVPGSHYSGRNPNDEKTPVFEGKKPVPVLGRAGDIYLHNGQCWHRGAPNSSDRVRYLLQLAYGRRWISQRLYPFVNYQIPAHVMERSDDRRKRVLGVHPKGAYG